MTKCNLRVISAVASAKSRKYIMKSHGCAIVLLLLFIQNTVAQCKRGRSATFARWSGVAPEHATPVFVYSASGEEDSLSGACISRCRELEDCASVVVMYGKGNCQGLAAMRDTQFRVDNDAAYFRKICLPLADECRHRWWALEITPGYHLHADSPHAKVIINTTIHECYEALLVPNREKLYRSSQWVGPDSNFDPESIQTSDTAVGNCVLNTEDKFIEPESYRVSNYYTFYLENQCRHDYLKKIDRCSYEEYNNQTLKHVEFTIKNYTKDECKRACEIEDRFVCRGFTWRTDRRITTAGRGACDLHSEDLVTTGSWLLRRTNGAAYYRRVICLNITVDCEDTNMIVTYRPRSLFRGRVYVPGHGEKCSARADNGVVRLTLPMHGDCDVNFAYGISNGPNGVINRTMAYVMVMIQNNPIIQTAGDRWVRVGCSPGAQASTQVDATVAVRDAGKPPPGGEVSLPAGPAAASAVFGARAAPLTMYVVRGAGGAGGAGGVSLGEPLELRMETTEPAEIQVYHLVASSRLGDSSVLLLDSRGCPTGQVDFPHFTRTWLNGVQRLSARFKAFRFPTSHVVRFALMVRFCDDKCPQIDCGTKSQLRAARQTNDTYYHWNEVPASVQPVVPSLSRSQAEVARGKNEVPRGGNEVPRAGDEVPRGENVIAQGGAAGCSGEGDALLMELEVLVDSRDILSTDTLVRADHRSSFPEESGDGGEGEGGGGGGGGGGGAGAVVCVHELLLVALALAWLAVQVLLLLGCCVLVKRYRNLAEMNMQKDYHSFDNVGFDTVSTHRRVHWPDQNIDILHT